MKLVDLNLLLYAVNEDAPHHETARAWLEGILASDEAVAMPWSVLLGFLRISTRVGIFPKPLEPEQAMETVEGWLGCPVVTVLRPGEGHWDILRRLLEGAGTAGNLTTDAHLAALAIEFDATLCSSDNDFARFEPELRFENPLKPRDGVDR